MYFLRLRLHRKKTFWTLIILGFVLVIHLSDQLDLEDLNPFNIFIDVVLEDSPGAWTDHPVILLHQRAEKIFSTLLQRQSNSPLEAEREYSRRYGRPPPPGFHQWAEYALAHKSPIIDDFDTISHAVHRYFNLTTTEITRRIHEATKRIPNEMYNDAVERCVFEDGSFGSGCRSFAEPLTTLLGDARQIAPKGEFLINFLDEPSVLSVRQRTEAGSVAPWRDLSRQPIGSIVAEACSLHGKSNEYKSARAPIDTYGLPFVQDAQADKNLCQHLEYDTSHGFLMSPASFRHAQTEIPLLSRAAPYPFSDILYPSTHYGLRSSLYSWWDDRIWARKKNAVYWAGSSTGGYWSRKTWFSGHRQRLATFGMNKEERSFHYLRPSSNTSVGMQVFTTNTFDASYFDIHLSKIVGCDSDSIRIEQERYFGLPRPADPESRPFRYRFVLDIDGNSYSGRFYRYLASRSVPLKLSIFHEWHDERLVPWLHYIPVSQSMDELPELVRFLATTAEGQRIGRRVAEAGREWYFKAMTPVHQGIYLYRLMLELAWMQNSSRPIV
jgi:hypothetical protein